MKECRNLSFYIKQGVHFDTAFVLAKLCPPKDTQTEVYGSGVKRINVSTQIKDISCTLASNLIYDIVGKLFKDSTISILVSPSKVGFRDILTHAQMIALIMVCIQGADEISQTFSVAKLPKH